LKKCNCAKKSPNVKSKDLYKEFNVLSLETMYKKAKEDLDDF
jgi:hypothetical protein